MIRRLGQIIGILILVTLQIVLGQWMGWWSPELVLAAILAIGILGEPVETVWWVAVGGFLLDMMMGSPVGFYLVSFGSIGLLVTALSRHVFQQPSPVVAIGLFAAIAVVYEFALAVITDTLGTQLLIRAVITAVVAAAIYIFFLTVGKRQEVIQLG